MGFKTSTKEKFTVISGLEGALAVTMTEELCRQLTAYLDAPVRNLVLNLEGVSSVEEASAEKLVKTQQDFYEKDASFVICCLRPEVEAQLDQMDLLELMNVTPSESEAWDIVQMEEIERELFSDDEEPEANGSLPS